MIKIWKRDFLSYFRSSIGYIFSGVFMILSGVIFYLYNISGLSGDLLTFLSQLTLLVMLLTPLLTMRLFCEESQAGISLLISAPVSSAAVVIGKYLAAASVMLATILLCNIFVVIIMLFGHIYPGEWLAGFSGFALQSLSFLALDLLAAAIAVHPLSAAVLAFCANFILWIIDLIADSIPIVWIRNVLAFISLYDQYEPFRLGQFSPAGAVFFFCFIASCIAVAVWVLYMQIHSERRGRL